MPPRLTVQTVDAIPCDSQVRDYDQLKTEAKQYVAELVERGTAITVSARVAGCFDTNEIINYTNYLRVEK